MARKMGWSWCEEQRENSKEGEMLRAKHPTPFALICELDHVKNRLAVPLRKPEENRMFYLIRRERGQACKDGMEG